MTVPAVRPAPRPRPRRPRAAAGALALVLATGGAGTLLAGAPPAGAAPALAAGCRAPAPKATGAGSAKAAVKRLVRRAGTDLTKAPKVSSPSGAKPRRLITEDIVRCGGAKARTGQTVQARYTLVAWGGRDTVLDSTWKAGTTPASLPLDEDVLVKGFVRGVRGMTPGSRRVVVVPPRLGYGDRAGAGVPRNSTLIFVVDLVAVG